MMLLPKWRVQFSGKTNSRCFFNTYSLILTGMLLLSPVSSSEEEITLSYVFSLAQNINQNMDLVRMESGMPKVGMSPLYIADASPRKKVHDQKKVTSFDDFSIIQNFNRNLNLIRMELGMPKAKQSPSYITNASPREVFYQAATLCEKSSHLRFEWTRTQGNCPPLKFGIIQTANVFNDLQAAMENINSVKRHFNIKESPEVTSIDKTKTSTDVFMAIVEGNRQLNKLLRKRYLPDNVFREVTLAIYYTAALLRHFPDVEQRIPSEPIFTPRKTPENVYLRLVKGFALVRQIATLSGDTVLNLKVNKKALSHVTPSDVYDVASVIVSELAYLHWQTGSKHIMKSYQPPPKIPAQVFQRAGILVPQLQMLLEQVKKHPDWLRSR